MTVETPPMTMRAAEIVIPFRRHPNVMTTMTMMTMGRAHLPSS